MTTGRLVAALRLIENEWRKPKREGPLQPDTPLQVEHMLPQDWRAHWPVSPEPEDTMLDPEQERDAHLHRLGNLTLVSPAMNPALSNRPWPEKRELLREHSNALVTTRYLDQPDWNEATIRERGEALIDQLVRIWPGPEGSFTAPRPLPTAALH
jgi:hypothetical protein